MQNRTSFSLNSVLTIFLSLALVLGTLSLAACGGSNANEQDNCYGEDMPVINE